MKISIAMTTYNGEKYILDQLESILNQTRNADEVIICDDCSTDNTPNIIKEFIQKRNLENWTFNINPYNKGWKKNFLDTINMTTGDIIFCADQDDIWIEDKIDSMYNVMIKNPNVYCLAGLFETINHDNEAINFNRLNKINRKKYNPNEIIQKEFNERINTFDVYGCTMCFNSIIREIIKEIDYEYFPHDAQAWQIGTVLDGSYFYNRVVIKYRIHGNNSGGVSTVNNIGKSDVEKRIKSIIQYKVWMLKLIEHLKSKKINNIRYKEKVINNSIVANENREMFLNTKKIINYIKCIRYINYYHSKSTCIGDFCYAYNINEISGKIIWTLKNKFIK